MRKCLAQRAIGRIVLDGKVVGAVSNPGCRGAGSRNAVSRTGEKWSVNMSLDDKKLNCQRQQREPEEEWIRARRTHRAIAAIARVQTSEMAAFNHFPPELAPRVLDEC
jgi:hypothetical protein